MLKHLKIALIGTGLLSAGAAATSIGVIPFFSGEPLHPQEISWVMGKIEVLATDSNGQQLIRIDQGKAASLYNDLFKRSEGVLLLEDASRNASFLEGPDLVCAHKLSCAEENELLDKVCRNNDLSCLETFFLFHSSYHCAYSFDPQQLTTQAVAWKVLDQNQVCRKIPGLDPDRPAALKSPVQVRNPYRDRSVRVAGTFVDRNGVPSFVAMENLYSTDGQIIEQDGVYPDIDFMLQKSADLYAGLWVYRFDPAWKVREQKNIDGFYSLLINRAHRLKKNDRIKTSGLMPGGTFKILELRSSAEGTWVKLDLALTKENQDFALQPDPSIVLAKNL